MNYNEDDQLEMTLRREAQSVKPKPQVLRRILSRIPSTTSHWKWLFAIPVFAVAIFAFVYQKTPHSDFDILAEVPLEAEEVVVYEELSNIDADLFSELDDEDSDLLDILQEGSIVVAL